MERAHEGELTRHLCHEKHAIGLAAAEICRTVTRGSEYSAARAAGIGFGRTDAVLNVPMRRRSAEYCPQVDPPANGSSPFHTWTSRINHLGRRRPRRPTATMYEQGCWSSWGRRGATPRRSRSPFFTATCSPARSGWAPRVSPREGRLRSLQSRRTKLGCRGKPRVIDGIGWIYVKGLGVGDHRNWWITSPALPMWCLLALY